MEAYVYGHKRRLPPEFAEFFDRGRTAIVSIDMHQGHLADTPDCPCPAPRGREIVAPIDRFHRAARALRVPLIHVRTILRKGGIDDVKGLKSAWRLTFPLYVGPIPNADQHAIEGTRWLRNLDARVLVIDGAMTDCCVLNATFEGSNLGYRIIVLQDLVRGTNEEMDGAALKMVSLHLGIVMDSADLLAVWRGTEPSRAAAE